MIVTTAIHHPSFCQSYSNSEGAGVYVEEKQTLLNDLAVPDLAAPLTTLAVVTWQLRFGDYGE